MAVIPSEKKRSLKIRPKVCCIGLVPVDVFDPPEQQIQRVVDLGTGATMEIYGKYLTIVLLSTPSRLSPQTGRRSMPVPFCRRATPVRLDESRCPLADHDRWSGRVPGRHLGHDGRVSHAQTVDAVHPQPRVDHRHPVADRAHFAGTGLMILRAGVLAHGAPPVVVA